HREPLERITGLKLDPYFSAPKMSWLRKNRGPQGVVTTTDTWLCHRMTGAYVTDAATASRSMLLDLKSVTWSDEACRHFGIHRSELTKIVNCAEMVGITKCFGVEAPLTALITDQQAALFGQGCTQPGDAKCTYGTGAFFLATTGPQIQHSES